MNAPFNEVSSVDLAKMLKVDRSTVTAWCRSGKIECINVGKGSTNSRWVIPQKEVDYLLKLRKEFGSTRNAMLHYENVGTRFGQAILKEAEEEINRPANKPRTFVDDYYDAVKEEAKPSQKFDIDDVALKLARVQEIKERLENLDAEKNQLNNELNDLKRDIMAFIE